MSNLNSDTQHDKNCCAPAPRRHSEEEHVPQAESAPFFQLILCDDKATTATARMAKSLRVFLIFHVI